MSNESVSQKVGSILSSILSDKYDAEITIKFKEEGDQNETTRNNRRTSGNNPNARRRNKRIKG